MIKRALGALIAVFLLISSVAFAEESSPKTSFFIETQTLLSGGKPSTHFEGLGLRGFTDNLGAFGFFWVGEDYAQIYLGPTLTPTPWLQLGLGLGLEQAENPFRVGGFALFADDRYSLLTVLEAGGSGFWYKAELNAKTADWLGLGAMLQKDTGIGPRFEITIPKTPLQFWGAALHDWEKSNTNFLFGVRFNF